jgi:PmbA protein
VIDLREIVDGALAAARDGESVEAYAEESRRTEIDARKGEVEGLTSAESRGLGVRVIAEGRLGFAYVADPSIEEAREAVARARENAAVATEDEFNALPDAQPWEPIDGLFFEEQAAMPPEDKVALALELERVAVSTDPRVTKVESCSFGDAIGRIAMGSTAGVDAEFRRTGASSAPSPSRTGIRRPGSRSRSRTAFPTSIRTRSPARPSSARRGCSEP